MTRDHRRIVRETFSANGGSEVDTQGDAFFYSFGRARDADRAAVAAQRALEANEWPDGAAVRVRTGLHTREHHRLERRREVTDLDGDRISLS